jgi:hypothetical protein
VDGQPQAADGREVGRHSLQQRCGPGRAVRRGRAAASGRRPRGRQAFPRTAVRTGQGRPPWTGSRKRPTAARSAGIPSNSGAERVGPSAVEGAANGRRPRGRQASPRTAVRNGQGHPLLRGPQTADRREVGRRARRRQRAATTSHTQRGVIRPSDGPVLPCACWQFHFRSASRTYKGADVHRASVRAFGPRLSHAPPGTASGRPDGPYRAARGGDSAPDTSRTCLRAAARALSAVRFSDAGHSRRSNCRHGTPWRETSSSPTSGFAVQ